MVIYVVAFDIQKATTPNGVPYLLTNIEINNVLINVVTPLLSDLHLSTF